MQRQTTLHQKGVLTAAVATMTQHSFHPAMMMKRHQVGIQVVVANCSHNFERLLTEKNVRPHCSAYASTAAGHLDR